VIARPAGDPNINPATIPASRAINHHELAACRELLSRATIARFSSRAKSMLIPNRNPREILTRERCYIRELLNDEAVPQASIAETRVPPGVTTELHRLSVAEWYVIESGQGLMEVGGGAPFAVGPGDVVAISPQVSQRITATGPVELRFLCLCLPAFAPECYESLESSQD
jgi:mannose-6-phosphate isomerase-like protein (cupin superfamily)